jgi:23S rRNA (uracil1939-C5)-methyltransferase
MGLKIKSTAVVKVERPAYGDVSIGRYGGKVVMIKGAVLPGESAEINIENEKKDYLTASVRKIIDPSPYRIKPACIYFGSCGGCHFQHIPYDRQILLKEEILRDCLKRLAKVEAELSEPVTADNPWNYRFRGQFKIARDKIGFYRESTTEVVDIDSCALMAEEVNNYFQEARAMLEGFDVKEMHITKGDRLTVLIKDPARVRSGADLDKLASRFLDSGSAGLFIETAGKKVFVYGEPFITLNLENLKYTVSPMSFFQSHWRMNRVVAELIKKDLQPVKNRKILDLYAGAGNFSLPLTTDAEVIAVEENPFAVEDGRRNLEINKIKSCRFVRVSAEKFHARDNFYAAILDPPRNGLTNRTMNNVLALKPERIVYISCNPATFSRDLKKLTVKYDIESIRMIDFFPQTFHIESLAFLRLR